MPYPKSPEEIAALMEKEHLARIKGDPYAAFLYARNVIKGRWPEVEPIILKHPYVAYGYLRSIIKGKWPELEKVLVNEIDFRLDDLNNIEDEFSDGESITWHDVSNLYTAFVDNWPPTG